MSLPQGFAYIEHPNIKVNLVYYGRKNWMQKSLPGYDDNVGIALEEVCEKLYLVADNLASKGLGLVVYDAYRPMRATTALFDACKDPKMCNQTDDLYHPSFTRQQLYHKFIGDELCYATGTTVAVGLVNLATGKKLDMGGGFAEYDRKVDHRNKLPGTVAENRATLRDAMQSQDLYNHYTVWWQFSLPSKVTREIYHDFPIKKIRVSCCTRWGRFFCGRSSYSPINNGLADTEIVALKTDNPIQIEREDTTEISDTSSGKADPENYLEFASESDEEMHYGPKPESGNPQNEYWI